VSILRLRNYYSGDHSHRLSGTLVVVAAAMHDLLGGGGPIDLLASLAALIDHEPNVTANLANASSLLFHSLPNLNWCGFYLFDGKQLVVGPFQGKPACVRIDLGKGVCGTAAMSRSTVLVPNVHEFPGHIACDSASESEIVIPMIGQDQRLVGVLDLDSPILNRFSTEDAVLLEEFVKRLLVHLKL